MQDKKILYGICGIGSGHFYRQKPIIDHLLSQNWFIHFFVYANSLKLAKDHYALYKNVKISEVQVPNIPTGAQQPLDFDKASALNTHYDIALNFKAFASVLNESTKPFAVISDYEPNCASFGYAHDLPVISIDQQSKFFVSSFFEPIDGILPDNEIFRLRYFIPKAKRFACSFFEVPDCSEVQIIKPTIRNAIRLLKEENRLKNPKNLLCYISSHDYNRNRAKLFCDKLFALRDYKITVFVPTSLEQFYLEKEYPKLKILSYNDELFIDHLATTSAVLCTAGHNLLSECVFLKIPVLAYALDNYEQKLNANMIEKNEWGLRASEDLSNISKFLDNLNTFYKKASWQESLIDSEILIEQYLRSLLN